MIIERSEDFLQGRDGVGHVPFAFFG